MNLSSDFKRDQILCEVEVRLIILNFHLFNSVVCVSFDF